MLTTIEAVGEELLIQQAVGASAILPNGNVIQSVAWSFVTGW
jgi:hypothetical protein